jgi:hypothetical protein
VGEVSSRGEIGELIDELIVKFYGCGSDSECSGLFREIASYLASNWVYLVGWSGFGAWGNYYVSPDRRRCVYIARNPRVEPVLRVVEEVEFTDPLDLANRIWRDQKGIIPFKRIKERFREVFGVDVEMSRENELIVELFGESSG